MRAIFKGHFKMPFPSEIDVRDYGAVFDGRDNTVAIQAALNAAATAEVRTVLMPAGASLVSATLQVPSGVGLRGQGRVNTFLRKTAEFGDMLHFGTTASPYQSGYVGDFWAYHDYGLGIALPNVPADVTYPSGAGAILSFDGPYNSTISNVAATGGQTQIRVRGGSTSTFINCMASGVYDPAQPSLQFAQSSVLIEIGASGQIPTNIDFVSCSFSGTVSPPRSITWPAPGGGTRVQASTAQNIGPLRVMQIKCCESVTMYGGYLGAGAKHNLCFTAGSDIIGGFSAANVFMDAAHEAQVGFEGSGIPFSIALHMREWVGQNNGFSALTDQGSTAAYSVAGLAVSGEMRFFVGPAVRLAKARRVTLDSDIRQWNSMSFYDGDAGYNCGVDLGAAARNIVVRGMIGGDNASLPAAHTVVGVNIAAGATQIETADVVDGGVSGQLIVGGLDKAWIRIDDADFTLVPRVDAFNIDYLGTMTADRTITLSKAGARNGDVFSITRSGPGGHTLLVQGVTAKPLATNQWVDFQFVADQWRESASARSRRPGQRAPRGALFSYAASTSSE